MKTVLTFFDDIVAAAMMNRDARDGDGEFGDEVGSVSKQSSRKSGWFGCCFGSFASATDKANQPKVSVVATRRAGDVVGEMALLVPDVRGTRSCSVRATSPEVLTSVISKTHLWSHLRLQNPEVLESMRLASAFRESELVKARALGKINSRGEK